MIHVAVIDYGDGQNYYAAKTRKKLFEHLAAWVHTWWSQWKIDEDIDPEWDDETLVKNYFLENDIDALYLGETELY